MGACACAAGEDGQLVDLVDTLEAAPIQHSPSRFDLVDFKKPLTVIIFGVGGDLARKKLFPALYQLVYGCPDAPLLPKGTHIIGFDREDIGLAALLERQCVKIKGPHKQDFKRQVRYCQGSCTSEDDFAKLNELAGQLEGNVASNRLFFLSIPPFIFGETCRHVKNKACARAGGYTRLIIEKPFGRDSRTFAELDRITSGLFAEEQLFRIDHYLCKEVVLNLMTIRFANQIYEPLLDRAHIQSIQFLFKEDLGTGGRGGYFDQFGIIRDIVQNHLLQVFMWLCMDPPETLGAEAIERQKIKLLKATQTVRLKDCFLGQYTANTWLVDGKEHTEPGYLDDPTVPAGSTCPTYAALVLRVNNARWRGVPFLFRAGKGMDERMAEVRITFKPQAHNRLMSGSCNELVFRIQPDEAIYTKTMNKVPGWEKSRIDSVVGSMSYQDNFPRAYVADAYERVFLNAAKGDRSLFVGSRELVEAWRIFTPVLDEIASSKPSPVLYRFGDPLPEGLTEFAAARGVKVEETWQEYLAVAGTDLAQLKKMFDELDVNGDGSLDAIELCQLVKNTQGAEPPLNVAARMVQQIDTSGNGKLEFEEVQRAVVAMRSWILGVD